MTTAGVETASGGFLGDREMRCVLQMALAFMLLFAAFDAQAFIIEMSLRSIAEHSPNVTNIVPFDGYYGCLV